MILNPGSVKQLPGLLGKIKSKEGILPLIKALQDPKREMAVACARALGAMGDGRALEPLTKALFESPPKIAGAAAKALGDLGIKESIPFLILCLEEKKDCPF